MNGFRRFVSPWLALLLLSAVVGCPRPQPTTGPAVGDGSTDKPREGAVPAEPPKYKDLLTLPVLAAEDMRKTLAQPPRALPAFQVVPHRLAFIPNSQALISKAKATVIVEKWNALEALGRVKEGTTETVPEPLGDYPGFGCAIIRLSQLPGAQPNKSWVMGKVLDGNGYHPGLAVSPDGARLYETTNSPKLHTKVWQLADRKHLADLECDEPVIHPNGKWLVHLVDRPLDNGDFLRALDAATGREVKEFKFYTRGSLSGRSKDSDVIEVKPKIVPQLAFNHSASVNTLFTLSPPDGNLLAFVGSARATDPVRLLVVSSDPSGKPVIQLAKPDDPLKLPAKILFTPDGKRLVGLSHPEYGPLEKDRPDVVRVWQVSDAKVLVNVKIPARASDFALSPDGHWIALGCGDGQVRLLATATGAEVLALKGHTRPVSVLAFSNDGKMLAAGSEDGTVRVWKAE